MQKVTPTSSRKADHIRINLKEDVGSGITTGLERYHFIHEALPEISLSDVNTKVDVFGKTLNAPILISSMTGGTEEAARFNQTLAEAAQATRIAMGLGSQRVALEQPELAKTFKIRNVAPDILLFANLGAIQLNYGYNADHCMKAVDMVEADALILHLNPLQEAVQTEGNTNFDGLLKKIEQVCESLNIPVIAKEVGWGISGESARKLVDCGIAAIDVAGAGGTSWTQVEMHRATNSSQANLASMYRNWGIPTADSIVQVKKSCPNIPIFASGGVRSGLDIAKCIALGAILGGMAGPFLKAAAKSAEATIQAIQDTHKEIRVTMFVTGSLCASELATQLVKTS
jgi:isopentenyl-diphosphate delta-isomerase